MSYTIITDTCCDLTAQMYKDLRLEVVPLSLNYQGKTHNQFPDSFIQEMYAGLRAGETATTSAANPEDWATVIRPVLQRGEDALVMAFSSGLSTTYQSAVIAAQDLLQEFPERKVLVSDTLSASMGQGLLAWYACQKRDAGMSLEELFAWCEEYKFKICHFFTVDDLMYLKRGGRVSAATALLGTMLQIKPVLHVDDEGHLISISKARGRKAAIHALLDKAAQLGLPGQNEVMFLSHGDCLEEAQYLADLLKEKLGVKEVVLNYVGAVIGSHSGPGTLALFFLGEHR